MPNSPLSLVSINGQLQSDLSVFDRGLQYGDGFFTTAKIEQGLLLNWTAHWQRVQMSCQRLGFPQLDQRQLQLEILQLFAGLSVEQQQASWVLKLMVTRGEGGRGYLPPEDPKIMRVAILSAMPALADEPMSSEVSSVLLEVAPATAGIKHLNRLSNVLARQALSAGMLEAVMFNVFGNPVCGTQSNLYLVKQGKLLTSALNLSGVAGTAQALIKNLASEVGLQWQQQTLSLSDLLGAEQLFFSNAIRGIQCVSSLNLANVHNLASQFAKFNQTSINGNIERFLDASLSHELLTLRCEKAEDLRLLLKQQEQANAFSLISTQD